MRAWVGALVVVVAVLGCGQAPTAAPPDASGDGAVIADAGADSGTLPPDGAMPADGGDGGAVVRVETFINGEPQDHTLVAVQDGDEPWRVITGAQGVYTFVTYTGRYGVASVCEAGLWRISVSWATVAETSMVPVLCRREEPVGTDTSVSGQVTNAGLHGANLYFEGPISAYAYVPSDETSYSVPVASGIYELLAIAWVSESGECTPARLLRVEDVLATASSPTVLDLDYAAGTDATDADLTVLGVSASETWARDVNLVRRSGNMLTLTSARSCAPQVLPAAALGAGELQEIGVATTLVQPYRAATLLGTDLSVVTLELPPLPAAAPQVVTTSQTPLRFDVSFDLQPWMQEAGLTVQVAPSLAGGGFSVEATAGWLAGQGSFSTPDLSGIAGWQEAWETTTTQATGWSFYASACSDGPFATWASRHAGRTTQTVGMTGVP